MELPLNYESFKACNGKSGHDTLVVSKMVGRVESFLSDTIVPANTAASSHLNEEEVSNLSQIWAKTLHISVVQKHYCVQALSGMVNINIFSVLWVLNGPVYVIIFLSGS